METPSNQQKTAYLRANSIAPEASTESQEIHARGVQNGQAMGHAGFVPLVTDLSDTANPLTEPFGGQFVEGRGILSATPDLTHAVIGTSVTAVGSVVALTSGANPSQLALYEWQWAGGDAKQQLQLISVLPARAAHRPWDPYSGPATSSKGQWANLGWPGTRSPTTGRASSSRTHATNCTCVTPEQKKP